MTKMRRITAYGSRPGNGVVFPTDNAIQPEQAFTDYANALFNSGFEIVQTSPANRGWTYASPAFIQALTNYGISDFSGNPLTNTDDILAACANGAFYRGLIIPDAVEPTYDSPTVVTVDEAFLEGVSIDLTVNQGTPFQTNESFAAGGDLTFEESAGTIIGCLDNPSFDDIAEHIVTQVRNDVTSNGFSVDITRDGPVITLQQLNPALVNLLSNSWSVVVKVNGVVCNFSI